MHTLERVAVERNDNIPVQLFHSPNVHQLRDEPYELVLDVPYSQYSHMASDGTHLQPYELSPWRQRKSQAEVAHNHENSKLIPGSKYFCPAADSPNILLPWLMCGLDEAKFG